MTHPPAREKLAHIKEAKFGEMARRAARNLHYAITIILVIALLPAFSLAGLPFHFNWPGFLSAYWVGQTVRSIFAATILYVIGFPLRETLVPLWVHYRRQKPRFLVLALFVSLMLFEFGWKIGLIIIIDTVAFLEFFDRIEGDPGKLGRATRELVVPAAYLFVGLILVFSYNDVIASVEFVGKYSETYNWLDSLLLGGWSVSQVAHGIMSRIPSQMYVLLEAIYLGVFEEVGAALVLMAIFYGRQQALSFVGAILTAYYISMLVFYLWPGMSPFTICSGHFARFPHWLDFYKLQRITYLKPRLLYTHKTPLPVNTDYFIAFPCMHIALSLIPIWFMRKWKRILIVMIAYNAVLAAAILLLEQHYVVDLLGGALVAALAIYMVGVCSRAPSIE